MENNTQSMLPDIKHTITLKAPIHKVWEAVATAEGITAWFMPNDFQPIEGSEFQLNAGQYGMVHCKVTELDPPKRLTFDWGKDWSVTFELVERDNQTEFTLTHSGWDVNKVTEFGQTHTMVRDIMNMGWSGIGKKLSAYVE